MQFFALGCPLLANSDCTEEESKQSTTTVRVRGSRAHEFMRDKKEGILIQ